MVTVMDKVLTVDEVAEKLRVSRNKIVQLIDRGELSAMRVGRQYRIQEADFIDYVNRNYTGRTQQEETDEK